VLGGRWEVEGEEDEPSGVALIGDEGPGAGRGLGRGERRGRDVRRGDEPEQVPATHQRVERAVEAVAQGDLRDDEEHDPGRGAETPAPPARGAAATRAGRARGRQGGEGRLGPRRAENSGGHVGRRRNRPRGMRQLGDTLLQIDQLGETARALLQVRGERRRVVRFECAERIQPEHLSQLGVCHLVPQRFAGRERSNVRSFLSPSRAWDLTVPSGWSSRDAISDWLSPWKYARRSTWR